MPRWKGQAFQPWSTVWVVRYCFDCGQESAKSKNLCQTDNGSYHRYLSMGCVVGELPLVAKTCLVLVV